MSPKNRNPFKDFQSDQIQRKSRKIFTAHYACRNAALNLTPVTGTTNGFIFPIINSLIESWGVRLTWLDCNCWKQFHSKIWINDTIFLSFSRQICAGASFFPAHFAAFLFRIYCRCFGFCLLFYGNEDKHCLYAKAKAAILRSFGHSVKDKVNSLKKTER